MRLDWNDPHVRAARTVEEQIYEHYGLEIEDHFVEVPYLDCRVRVVETGSKDGSPLVAIPGGHGSGFIWTPLLPSLHNHRILVMDRPGGGLSDGIDHRHWPLRTIAVRSTAAVFDRFSLDAAPIVSHSIGSLWAFRFAQAHPDRVSAIPGLGCPGLYPGTSAPFPVRLVSLPVIGGTLISQIMRPDDANDARRALGFLGHPAETAGTLPDEFHEAMYLMQTLPTAHRSWTSLLRQALRLRGANPTAALTYEDLRRIRAPVQLLWGRNDPFGTTEAGRRGVEYFPDAEFHEVGIGHLPWLDEPDQCGDLVSTFLDEHGR